ncbi:MAG TPA: riboflavin synthase [Candidatus Polarisedimenticolaceae bacterium]
MFTGLIETVGEVVELRPASGSLRLVIASTLPAREMADGESVAIDGVCLTVTERKPGRLAFTAVQETLDRTTLGGVRPGARVNLERAARLSDRLGGHLVQGHVDAVAGVARVRARGDDHRMRVRLVPEIRGYVARKGSVALNGVSLTVSAVDRTTFEVALIPETLARTNLGALAAGSKVNVEVDLVARYLESLLAERRPG